MGNPLTAAAQNNTTSPVQTKDCKFCGKQGLLIWPLRYAVLGDKSEKCLDALPDISATLPNHPALKLEHSRYAVRTMRHGYLYVLVDRKKVMRWQGYLITFDGYLSEFPVAMPPSVDPTFTCSPDKCGLNASMVAIEKAEEVENAYFLYSPNPLTVPMLDMYSSKPEGYVTAGIMQVFHPRAWVTGTTKQAHSLTTAQIPSTLAELVVEKGSATNAGKALGEALRNSLYPTLYQTGEWLYTEAKRAGGFTFSGTRLYFEKLAAENAKTRFTKQHAYLSRQMQFGAAFVLNDPIGITQELNDIRNGGFTELQTFLDARDKYKISNERKLKIAEEIEDLKYSLQKNITIRGDNQAAYLQKGMEDTLRDIQYPRHMIGHPAEQIQYRENVAKQWRAERERVLKQAQIESKTIWSKYEKKLNTEEITQFRNTLKACTERAIKRATRHVNDHLTWIQSEHLLTGFDVYDTKHIGSGACFAGQVAECIQGMTGLPEGEKLIDQWANSLSADRKNLFMRAYALNQEDLTKAMDQGLKGLKPHSDQVHSVNDISGAVVIKSFKGLIDGFKKVDSAFEAWENDKSQFPGFLTKTTTGNRGVLTLEAKLFLWASEFTRSFFRTGLNNADKWITTAYGSLIYSRLGKLTEQIAYEDAMLKLTGDPKKIIAGYKGRSDKRNKELHNKKLERKAGIAAANKAEQVTGTLDEVLEDAKIRAKEKIKTAAKSYEIDLDAENPKNFKRPSNNYHQVRIGLLLGAIEAIALGDKIAHYQFSVKATLDGLGTLASLGSVLVDSVYSATKSIRELEKYAAKTDPINKAADILRGRLKLLSGLLSYGAGLISSIMDVWKLGEEIKNRNSNPLLMLLYTSRALATGRGAWLGWKAAQSYSVPLLEHELKAVGFKEMAKQAAARRAAIAAAAELAKDRALLLIKVARWSWIGFALTAGEIALRLWVLDDDLENWCDSCSFRKDKTGLFASRPAASAAEEIEELHQAFQAIAN